VSRFEAQSLKNLSAGTNFSSFQLTNRRHYDFKLEASSTEHSEFIAESVFDHRTYLVCHVVSETKPTDLHIVPSPLSVMQLTMTLAYFCKTCNSLPRNLNSVYTPPTIQLNRHGAQENQQGTHRLGPVRPVQLTIMCHTSPLVGSLQAGFLLERSNPTSI
jgi:hypothetical protein